MEVQFINTIEADNMRHDVMVRSQGWEQRVQTIANERARKSEEKAAKEAAAEERRKTAENVFVIVLLFQYILSNPLCARTTTHTLGMKKIIVV